MRCHYSVRLGVSSCAMALCLLSLSPARGAAAGAAVDQSRFQALYWRGIGPYRGGRVLAVAGVPGEPNVYYFGAVAGGVWKTTDSGASWVPLTDQTKITSIGAIAVAPSNHDILYVGTGEASPRGDMTYGNGVFKSLDGGKSWQSLGLADTRQIGALIVDPQNPDIVLLAALGHAFGPNAERGVYRTADGGKSWTKVLSKDSVTGAIDVAFDPRNSKIVYAALWQALRQPWNFSSGGPGSGLYRSIDGGITWTRLSGNGLPEGILGRIDISVSGANSERVYAMIEAKEGGLFRSDDAGKHWQLVNNDGRLRQRAWYFSKIYADPKNADVLYALNTGMFKSTDGGKTFDLVSARHGDHHGLWIDPADPDRLINASDGGAIISVDGGKSWTQANNQPTAQFYHVSVDNSFPYRLYGAQQDNTNVWIKSANDEGAIDERDWDTAGGGECGFVLADPRDPSIIYSDSENIINRFNRHTFQSETISAWPFDASGRAASQLAHRFNWTSPLAISPHDPDTFYWGAERLFKTTDEGKSWVAVSGDLTRNDKSKQIASGGPITKDITSVEYYDTIFAIAESPLMRGHLWVGTDDGLIQASSDGGGHWRNATPPDMPQWSTISMIELSHFDEGTAYVAVDRHKLDDVRPYVFKTSDDGKSWRRLDSGLPDGAFVHAVREDPAKRGLLYAATETGAFVSFDDGAHWQSLQLNLPQTPLHDLVVKDDDLVVATHGRSFWILDDVTPLRQIAAGSSGPTVQLYTPETAHRLYYPDQVDTRRPVGQNPPSGALIDYYLENKPAGDVTIDILDSDDKPVRHLSSKVAGTTEQPPEWPDQIVPNNTLPAARGMNRFVWNLRYDDPVQIPDAFYVGLAPRGPIALPGRYTVRLTVEGRSQTVPLQLLRDPRVKGPEDGLRQKFALSVETWHDLDALHRAVNDIREAKTEVAALDRKLDGKPGNASLLAEGDALVAAAEPIEGTLMQVNIKGSEGNLNFPDMLNEQIYAFAGGLEDADTAPTKQEVEMYAGLHAQLETQLDAWAQVKRTRLAVFRDHMKQAGM
jgi:photosystem II stability/assembly factor-like uncharacterized protein